MQNLHAGHRGRLRQKALHYGYDSLNDHELLELLLFNVFPQKNTNELAHNLINHFGSFKNVLEATPLELKDVEGFGEVSAVFVGAFMPIIQRYMLALASPRQILDNVRDVKQYAKALCMGHKVECAYAIYLDKGNRIICTTKLSKGNLEETAVYYEDIVQDALLHKAYYVILVHNHPSGRITPSNNDELATYTIQTSLANFRKILLDSIIVSGLEAYSMYEQSTLSNLKDRVCYRAIPEEKAVKINYTLEPKNQLTLHEHNDYT